MALLPFLFLAIIISKSLLLLFVSYKQGLCANNTKSAHSNRFELSVKNPAIRDSDYNGEVEVHSTEYEIERSKYDSDVDTKGFSVAIGKELIRDLYVGTRYKLDIVSENYDYSSDFMSTYNAQSAAFKAKINYLQIKIM